MKQNRILSAAGISRRNATKIRSYCNLMQSSLSCKWLFADEFVDSHVLFVSDGYLSTIPKEKLEKSQVVIVLYEDASEVSNPDYNYHYHLPTPLTGGDIREILNKITVEVPFKPINQEVLKSKKSAGLFKSAFKKIRKSFFGRSEKDILRKKETRKREFVQGLTKKVRPGRSLPCQVVLLGSPGSGKTTAIKSVAQGKVFGTDVSATDSVASEKEKTTVGIDFAEISIPQFSGPENKKLRLIGTPGQIKFNFIWDVVGKSSDAFIVLVDMSRPEPFAYLRFYTKFLKREIGSNASVFCALTHVEEYAGSVDSIVDCINDDFPQLSGIYDIDARNADTVLLMLTDIYPQIVSNTKVLKASATANGLNSPAIVSM